MEVADELDDAEIRAEALISARNVEGALELARREGLEELVADCLFTLAVAAAGHRAYDQAHGYVEAGVDHCVRHGNDLMLRYLLSEQALLQLDQGLWIERLNRPARSLRMRAVSTTPRIVSLVVLALVRARRGDPDAEPPLQEALGLAEPSGELIRIAPVAAARAEVAWLAGRPDEIPGLHGILPSRRRCS